jgi:hypothetical protein
MSQHRSLRLMPDPADACTGGVETSSIVLANSAKVEVESDMPLGSFGEDGPGSGGGSRLHRLKRHTKRTDPARRTARQEARTQPRFACTVPGAGPLHQREATQPPEIDKPDQGSEVLDSQTRRT